MTKALKAAELVLTAKTNDLAELANIAADASQIPAERILMGVDLTGVNLTNREINHLLDKQAHYHGAILSSAQRRQFNRAERSTGQRRMRMKIRSMRVNAIASFIESYVDGGEFIKSPQDNRKLTDEILRSILLEPLGERYKGDIPLDPKYTLDTLGALAPWAAMEHQHFYKAFFGLLYDLQAPTNQDVAEVLNDKYLRAFGGNLGNLIAQMHPTPAIDQYWVIHVGDQLKVLKQAEHDLSLPISEAVDTPLERAIQVSAARPLHQKAVERALDLIEENASAIEFLERVNFDCDGDEAERIAARITTVKWPPSETKLILKANVHPRVRGALFRQLLQQGNEARVIEVLRWLNADKGAVGALSLDNAFRNIRSFGVGLRFAEEAASSFADNQLAVVYFALRGLARTSSERTSLEAFRRRVKYNPPSAAPPQVLHSLGHDVEPVSKIFGVNFTEEDP